MEGRSDLVAPAGQVTGVAVVVGHSDPAGHWVHAVEAGASAYSPSRQALQTALPTALYVPARQSAAGPVTLHDIPETTRILAILLD